MNGVMTGMAVIVPALKRIQQALQAEIIVFSAAATGTTAAATVGLPVASTISQSIAAAAADFGFVFSLLPWTDLHFALFSFTLCIRAKRGLKLKIRNKNA